MRWEHGGVLRLLAFVLPLGLDSFAIAAALGTRRPAAAGRWRVSALFVGFEAGMPLVGLGIGVPAARLAGPVADYIAAAATLGLSISLDELAIGVTLGLAQLPVTPVIIAIAVQALAASQLGLALGSRIGTIWRERAEYLAGTALAVLGVVLIVRRLLG